LTGNFSYSSGQQFNIPSKTTSVQGHFFTNKRWTDFWPTNNIYISEKN